MAKGADGEPNKKLECVAQAMYRQTGATQSVWDELDAMMSEDAQECWSCNALVANIFWALRTQWNIGLNGVVGLRYESFPMIFSEFGIDQLAIPGVMRDLRVMECAALEIIYESK